MAADLRIAPLSDRVTDEYWAAARRRELVLQRCGDCDRFTHPPAEWCRGCGSERRTFVPVSGRGTVETFSVVHRTFAPGFAARVPYVLAWIALPEQTGLRAFGNVIDVEVDGVRIGLPVEVTFEDIDGYGAVPAFRPVREEKPCGSV